MSGSGWRAWSCRPGSGGRPHDGQRGYSGYLPSEHLPASLRRIGLHSLYGIALGLVVGLVPTVRALLNPLITFVRTLPPLAYFSLLIIWPGIDEPPKVSLLLVAALPPVAVATADAVRGVNEDYPHAARSLGAGRWQLPYRIAPPSALPAVITGIRVAAGVAYTTGVAAETVNGVPGIGGMIRTRPPATHRAPARALARQGMTPKASAMKHRPLPVLAPILFLAACSTGTGATPSATPNADVSPREGLTCTVECRSWCDMAN